MNYFFFWFFIQKMSGWFDFNISNLTFDFKSMWICSSKFEELSSVGQNWSALEIFFCKVIWRSTVDYFQIIRISKTWQNELFFHLIFIQKMSGWFNFNLSNLDFNFKSVWTCSSKSEELSSVGQNRSALEIFFCKLIWRLTIDNLNVVILRPVPTGNFCFFVKILFQTRRMKTLRVSTCIYRSRRTNL